LPAFKNRISAQVERHSKLSDCDGRKSEQSAARRD
jgi:hypothetical protein